MIGKMLIRSFVVLTLGVWCIVSVDSARAAVLALQNADSYDFHGARVDIDGDTIVIGGPYAGDEGHGWAQVFVHTETGWEYQQTLESDDPTLDEYSQFGYGVGVENDRIVVGANGNNTVYAFGRASNVWSEDPSFRLQSGSAGFGCDTRIDGGQIIAGADQAKAAFLFTDGILEGQSLPASGTRQDFGYSVGLSGPRAIVGDPTANTVHLYLNQYDSQSDEWSWTEEAAYSRGSSNDRFGCSVAISGDYAIVGAEETDLGAQYNAGSATIYHHDGAGWTDPVTLAPTELTAADRFGSSVALSDDIAVVGAVNQGPFGARTGSVYVFQRIGDAWLQIGKLRPDDGEPGDQFGSSVAIDGNWIVVGASYKDEYQGAAYVFEVPTLYTPIPGDADLDGYVDADDAAILAAHWGNANMQWTDGDFNRDQRVNALDASILAANWHAGTQEQAPVSVPEPSIAMLLAGLLLFLPRRRRQ